MVGHYYQPSFDFASFTIYDALEHSFGMASIWMEITNDSNDKNLTYIPIGEKSIHECMGGEGM